MKRFFLPTIAAAAMLSGVSGAEPADTEKTVVVSEIRKCVKNADRIEFTGDGMAELYAADGTSLGHVRFTYPFSAGKKGFRGPVPVMVFVNPKGKIVTVRPLPNREDARFWQRLIRGGFFDSWSGFTAKEAVDLELDGVTGATYSSRGAIGSTRELLRKETK